MAVVKYGLTANVCTDHGEGNIGWRMMLDKHDAGDNVLLLVVQRTMSALNSYDVMCTDQLL